MALFLDQYSLKKELLQLFEDADEYIILISPFIKLADEMKRSLIKKANDKKFQNVEIFYNQHLHAKYYANDRASIITSLNLHQYSFKNNIEIGVMFEHQLFNLGKDSKLDSEMFEYMEKIKEQSELVYEKTTNEESFFFGLFKGETKQEVHYDATKEVYGNQSYSSTIHSSIKEKQPKSGFCIRTGKPIPFNLEKPFCYEAYVSWSQYANEEYKEKFSQLLLLPLSCSQI